MKIEKNINTGYEYSSIEVGPYRINQVDDYLVDDRQTQEVSEIVLEIASEFIVYGEKITTKLKDVAKSR